MNNPTPASRTIEPAQLRKTLRNVLRPAYACAEAPQREYPNEDFVELAALAAARDKSLHVTSTTNGRLPDSDSFHDHLADQTYAHILKAGQAALAGLLDLAEDLGWLGPSAIAIDRHDEPYYGDDASIHVVRTKNKAGTNKAHAYLTSCRLSEPRIGLALEPMTVFRDQHDALQDLLETTLARHPVTVAFLDKAFYTAKDLRLLLDVGVDFVVAAPRNQAIRALAEAVRPAARRVAPARHVAAVPYTVGDKDRVDVTLVLQWRPDPDEEGEEILFAYATNTFRPLATHHEHAEAYRTRWGIETGYRITESARIRTSTTKWPNRIFLSLFAILWSDRKSVV